MKRLILCAAVALCGAGHTQADTVIETLSTWPDQGVGDMWGLAESQPDREYLGSTTGQTFTVLGLDTVLDSMTFFVRNRHMGENTGIIDFVDFGIYVMEWGDRKATGPILYESEMLTPTIRNSLPHEYEEFTVHTGGIELTAGHQYVAFMSTWEYLDGELGIASIAGAGDYRDLADNPYYADVYPGGNFVWQESGDDLSVLTTQVWGVQHPMDPAGGWDLAFSITLVPEPSSIILLLTAAVGFLAWRRRRTQRQSAA